MPRLSYETIVFLRTEFEKSLKGYSVQIKDINDKERIYILEDSHILCVRFVISALSFALNKKSDEEKNNPFLDTWNENDECYVMEIVELTYNTLCWKYNNADFIRRMAKKTNIGLLEACIFYTKFKGMERVYWNLDEESYPEKMSRLYPELRLKERYESWVGNLYRYIIFEVEDIDGKNHYVVSYTMSSPSSYVNTMGKKYIITGTFCNGNTRRDYSWDFEKALNSWNDLKRQQRLEKHLRYCVVEKYNKEFDETWRYADELLKRARNGDFEFVEKNSYIRPSNRWITEEYVYKTTKKIYKDYKVIYQHRPFFLKSSKGGQMSYDIFICGLNVAIEYQGKQHFEAVEFFGGEEGLKSVKQRDEEKAKLSKAYNVKLVYINYDEEVTPALIKNRVEGLDDAVDII